MTQQLKVIVTGANRGIGNAIGKAILKPSTSGAATTSLHNVKLYACSRSGDDLHLQTTDDSSVEYKKLDIADAKSIERLSSEFDNQKENIVLINNAGINLDREAGLDIAKRTLEVNYYGTLNMCQSIIPHMAPGSRIVNVSSIASVLKLYQENIRERFRHAKSLQELETLIDEYMTCVKDSTEEASGWGIRGRSYNVSKALLNAATRILAEEHKDIQINSCCPGWVDTDMGQIVGKPSKTLEQGAIIPMRLAFGDIGDVSGQFWANSSVSSTEAGQVKRP